MEEKEKMCPLLQEECIREKCKWFIPEGCGCDSGCCAIEEINYGIKLLYLRI